MEKRYQVFISSTFQDLQPARQEVSQALLRADCFPAGMELFPAADEEQFEFIKQVIDQSDYYIIISAGRYGSIHPETGLSYTEMEYDYAVETGKPVIRLLHEDPFNALKGEFIEKTAKSQKLLKKFRRKLEQRSLVNYWNDYNELGLAVVHSLSDAKKRSPSGGWVRGERVGPSDNSIREFLVERFNALEGNHDDLMDEIPLGLIRLDLDGTIAHANSAAKNLFGGQINTGNNISKLVDGLGRTMSERISTVATGRQTSRSEVARATVEGVEIYVQVTLSLGQSEKQKSILAVVTDATELKTLEEQFVQSQKMQTLGQLAGGFSLDFNSLLTAISDHCALLLMRHNPSDLNYSDLIQIRQNTNRAASLVGQLLAFSRKQTLLPKVLDLNVTLKELSRLLNRLLGEKATLIIVNAPDLSKVRVDERQFEQVIMNLVVNARDAMPQGGEVTIRTRNQTFEVDYCRDRTVVPAGDYVRIEVADTGDGIPIEKQKMIFEPFYTTKPLGEGSGLGLSTVYGIIRQSGGFVFLDSIVGEGSTFSILLPV